MHDQVHHLIPIATAAAHLGISPKLFANAVHSGQMPGVEILVLGMRGQRYVRGSSLADFIEGKTAAHSLSAAVAQGQQS